jgi:hypothetical protein
MERHHLHRRAADPAAYTTRAALSALCCSVLLVACGGSDDPEVEAGSNAPSTTTSTTTPVAPSPAPTAATPAPPPPAPAPSAAASTASWSLCARENDTCRLPGTRLVRYGQDGKFVYRTFSSSVRCSNDVFGDPIPGVFKRCEVSNAPAPAVAAAPVPAPAPAPAPAPSPAPAPAAAPAPTNSPSQGPMPTPLTIAGKPTVGRIVATAGQVIENVHVTNPGGSCIVVNGVSNVVIRNAEIGPCGAEGNPNAHGVEITNASNITIERNVIHDVSSAVYAMDSRHPIVMDRNYVYNVRGPFPRGQMIQMNRVTGGSAPSRVTCNLSDAAPGRRYGVEHGVTNAGIEDHVNLFESPGLPGADTLIAYNRLRGGHKTSRSGSGIMMGDYGGGRITARGNVVVDVPNVGIGIAGGSDITIEDNLIYQNRNAGIYVNLGIMVWGVAGPSCPGNHAVRGNRVWTLNSLGAQNPFWDGGNCGPIAMSGNTFGDASLGPTLFDEVPAPCR